MGLAFLAPDTDWTQIASQPQEAVDPDLVAGYMALSGGAPPGQAAWWAYAAAQRLLDALDAVARAEGHPTRAAVRSALMAGH